MLKYRILIAEDEKPQADRIAFLLKEHVKENIDITVIYGVQKNALMKKYDIAIVDLNMPYDDYSPSDDNAGKLIIDNLINQNPDIYIIIRTAVSHIETIANASNAAGRGAFRYVSKANHNEKDIIIDEVRKQIREISTKYPDRIDYGNLSYIHKAGDMYTPDDWKAYRHDQIYVNGELIELPIGKQKYALYKYLVNKRRWLQDTQILSSVGYRDDGPPEQTSKRFRDNIIKNFQFLKDTDLEFESKYGLAQHRLILKSEKGKYD